ncbi:hypothetical protein [Bradyrhizobium sp. BRP56]|uniref:hypothetical protein n=1 Tax=Bradyrhizobium sp. BRP56 TaxID=2793819 RepID=UPI001CD3CD45|nr:hypothetical protein [Bradyrhizobium sp. BRP56]MCA1400212.1 hypothetical protein [Bradyrhizobium sp. BRP56]
MIDPDQRGAIAAYGQAPDGVCIWLVYVEELRRLLIMQSRERWFAIIFLARAAIGAPIAWNLYFQPLHAGELYVLCFSRFPP